MYIVYVIRQKKKKQGNTFRFQVFQIFHFMDKNLLCVFSYTKI